MPRQIKSNPVDVAAFSQIVHRFCESIKRAAKKYDLPLPILDEECKIEKNSSLGQGEYGAVWTTEDSTVAFKLSTDASEAHFIQTAINLRKNGIADPAGMVDYRAVFRLPVKHQGWEVFAIWREQATHVGLPCEILKSDTEMIAFATLLDKFYTATDLAFELAFKEQREYNDMDEYFDWIEERVEIANEIIDGKKPRYDSIFSKLLARCYRLAIQIEDSGESGRHVGEALLTYFEHGILLCDLHGNNVGLVDRSKCREIFVITDPGHSLTLTRSLIDVEIPVLKE